MFIQDQAVIEAWAQQNPRHTYETIRFVIATAHRKFALVQRVLATDTGFSQQQRTSLAFLYAGRHMVYKTIQAKRHDPVALMTYLVSLPNLGVAKAGFTAQLLTGTVGCLDVWNMRDTHIQRMLGDTPIDAKMMRIDSTTSERTIASKLFQYCGLCAYLGCGFLWDKWCTTVAQQYKPGNTWYPWRTAQEVSTFHLTCLGL